jgi:hypothetical protein
MKQCLNDQYHKDFESMKAAILKTTTSVHHTWAGSHLLAHLALSNIPKLLWQHHNPREIYISINENTLQESGHVFVLPGNARGQAYTGVATAAATGSPPGACQIEEWVGNGSIG